MDVTQIGLGLALLGVSSLTLASPAVLDSSAVSYGVTVLAIGVAIGALFFGIVHDDLRARPH